MKIKAILIATVSLLAIGGAWAQGIEYDDMYFNSEDRTKLKARQASDMTYRTSSNAKKFDVRDDERFNPTDSYSARNVNPEYTSRAHSEIAQEDERDYFVNNYQYNRTQYQDWNSNYNNWYNNAWYRTNYYGPAINSWNSPYYGYNSWNSPWHDPYWAHSGWSSSFSFHYGHSWNYGWGGNYNYWNRPFHGGWGDPFYSPYYSGLGWYGGSYWNNWRYPSVIIVNNEGGGRDIVHGKRPTRSASYVSENNASRQRSGYDTRPSVNRSSEVGRTSSDKQREYYNRYNQSQRSSGSSFDNRQSTQNNRSSSWGNDNSRYSPSNSRTSQPSYSPSRSSSGSNSSPGSGTNGRSRGRN